MEWWMWWLQQQCGQQQRGQLFGVLWLVHVVVAVLASAFGRGSDVAGRSFCGLVRVGQLCSWRVILPSSSGTFSPPPPCTMVQDVFWLYPYVHDEVHTHICGSGSGVAAVAIAVDRETANASRGLKWPEEQ